MPHKKIRRLRKGIQARKQSARESAEAKRERLREAKKKAAATKRRAERGVARVTVPIEDEAKQTARETRLLAREVGEPVSRAVEGGRSAAEAARAKAEAAQEAGSGLREKAAAFDERVAEIQAIEEDTLGMAGEDFGLDLEIVDDFERGEAMEGMGDVGLDVTFEDMEAADRDADTGMFSITDGIDDDLLGDFEEDMQ